MKNLGKQHINNQQGYINTIISQHKALEKERGITRDVTNPLYKAFLAGFFEGEGCCSIGCKISRDFKFGVRLSPVFAVYQSVSGILILNSFLDLLNTGSIVLKSGSNHVYTFSIAGYKKIIPSVLPFMHEFVLPFACKVDQFIMFETILLKLQNGDHKTKQGLIDMVTLAYSVKGKGNDRKRTLEEILSIIEDKDAYFDNLEKLGKLKTNEVELDSDLL